MVIFEEISAKYLLLIKWYLLKKEKIYFLRVHKSCQGLLWFNNYVANGSLKKSTIRFGLNSLDGFYCDAAFNNVEIFFRGYLNNGISESIKKLYKNPESDLAFKKVLNQRLARFYYINFILDSIQKTYSERRITFIPSNGVEVYRTDGCDIYDYHKFYGQAQRWGAQYRKINSVRFSLWAAVISYGNAFRRKFTLSGVAIMLPIFLLFKCIRNFEKYFECKKYYDYAITIISPSRQFANEIQKVDFLVDGGAIKKEQVVFIAQKGMTKDGKKYFIENKLNFVNDIAGYISLKIIVDILPVYFKLLFLSFKQASFIVETGFKGIYFYAIWKGLTQRIRIKKFITYCDYEVKSIFRNIILEQSSSETYLYMDSANFGCFAAKKTTSIEFRYYCFGFLYYDWFISWSDKVFDFFRRSSCQFKRHANLGCFWAEHMRLIREGALLGSHIKNRLYAKGYRNSMKLVSAFDSTFHDDSMSSYDDGIAFLRGLYKLVEELPDIFLILKEKKTRAYHETITAKYKEINALYKKFDDHPRCYLPGSKENSSEMMAFSNLVISFPFTSTTFEALAIKKKALWYDAAGRFRDTFYGNIPGLVCHTYEALFMRVDELLHKVSDIEYGRYLNDYVLGKVEPYLDGLAISRFKELLRSHDMIGKSSVSADRVIAFTR